MSTPPLLIPLSLKELGRIHINNANKNRSRNARRYPLNKLIRKLSTLKSCNDIIPIDFIISIFHINFDKQKTNLELIEV